jgi:hypothetical protein
VTPVAMPELTKSDVSNIVRPYKAGNVPNFERGISAGIKDLRCMLHGGVLASGINKFLDSTVRVSM